MIARLAMAAALLIPITTSSVIAKEMQYHVTSAAVHSDALRGSVRADATRHAAPSFSQARDRSRPFHSSPTAAGRQHWELLTSLPREYLDRDRNSRPSGRLFPCIDLNSVYLRSSLSEH
jgi:hypothetical protein